MKHIAKRHGLKEVEEAEVKAYPPDTDDLQALAEFFDPTDITELKGLEAAARRWVRAVNARGHKGRAARVSDPSP
ncbi:MAG: hypothetical protein ACPLPT_03870 [Moorellales bacterium]